MEQNGGQMKELGRNLQEERERVWLSPLAAFSADTRGRERASEPDPFRTEYQRDRDRILHCKSFRRLSHKTQVFLAPQGDHYRTRLTHTLEVAQIARSVARALRLNEDLTEAIALAHDLGHTPFGHTGEDALSECLARVKGLDPASHRDLYRHNEQSLRVVEVLEYEGRGLNLTWEVRDGISHHTGSARASTLEGRIVAIADRIAYVNHDIDDAIRGGVLSEADLPESTHRVLGSKHQDRIATLVNDLVATSARADDILLDDAIFSAMNELRSFLFEHVYFGSTAKVEEPKSRMLVTALFDHFLANQDEIPREIRATSGGDPVQAVVDYIAGMTDRFAITTFESLFVPRNWRA